MQKKNNMIANYNTVNSSNPGYHSITSNSYDERVRSHSPLQLPSTFKSQSIPISEGLYRTSSEMQLCIDEQAAEQKDLAFYSRVFRGICESQGVSKSWQAKQENHCTLLHVMQTRNTGLKLDQMNEEDDEWILGESLENDGQLLHGIASDANALTTPEVEEEGIFDMEL